jgi:hypothetical protein
MSALVVIALGALVVLLLMASNLVAAGMNADSTGTLTPSDQWLWVGAVGSFAVFLTTGGVLVSAQARLRHPLLTPLSALLLALGLSLLAYDMYWWWAAGSYADMANKQLPRSEWRSLPVTGSALFASALFSVTTFYLVTRRRTE